ncbi:MAG TPA: C40 family peptidase [Gemmatimonadales bacterium]|nr:C40 family peptidase [Gemmatimonadales bacterium]
MSERDGGERMEAVIVHAPVAPMVAEASVRAEQTTQLLLGETADLLERQGEWRRLRAHRDGYEGWVNAGYLRETTAAAAAAWAARATGWSEGAQLDLGGHARPLPLGARVVLEPGIAVELPDGRRGLIRGGYVREMAEIATEARDMAPERWALRHFEGVPYEWGGRTAWGVDCSGLVQTTWAARGLVLPRDSSKQAACGEPVALDRIAPGDLLFFHGETSRTITHVAFAGPGETLIHSTISCGGVLVEPCGAGTRAAPLMTRLVAARRLPSA